MSPTTRRSIRVHLIRHAESLYNEEMRKKRNWIKPRFCASGFDPKIRDPGLSSNGLTQIEKRRDFIQKIGSPDLIIVSPLFRALQTANGIWPEAKMTAEPRIRELTHNLSDCGTDTCAIHEQFPNVDFKSCDEEWWLGPNTPKHPRFWRGEPRDEIEERITSWKESLLSLPEETNVIFVVGHSNFFRILTSQPSKIDNVGMVTVDIHSNLGVTVVTDHQEAMNRL